MKAALAAQQPTTTVREGGREYVVLSELSLSSVNAMLPPGRVPSYLSRFVLTATPYLQHLDIVTRGDTVVPPPVADTFSLVPRLRSLRLSQLNHFRTDLTDGTFCMRDMLTPLPSLVALRCMKMPLGVQDLIDIAAHATLGNIHVFTRKASTVDKAWLPDGFDFHTDGKEEEADEEGEAERASDETMADSGDEKDSQASEPADRDARTIDMQRLPVALTRVTPSTRSILARLALTNFLHRALLPPEHPLSVQRSITLQRHYQQQVALLRSTLRQQLNERRLQSSAAASPSHSSTAAGKRGTKRTRSAASGSGEGSGLHQQGDGHGSDESDDERMQQHRARPIPAQRAADLV